MEEQTKTEKKSLSSETVLRLAASVISIAGGLFLGSSALVGDGLLTLQHLCSGASERRFSPIAVRVLGFLGLFLAVSGFFETSLTISYAASAVRILALPVLTVALLLRIAVLFLGKSGSFGWRELAVTAGVVLSVILSWLAAFYFEPALAAALGVWILCLGFFPAFFSREKKETDCE